MTAPTADGAVPDLVPARMVNEFSYCPRLFYLEWVDAQFTDNLDTVEGRWHHRAVDDGGGAVPLPDEGPLRVARSVQLSSATLGLVAKIDLLEADGDAVVPVDTKRGSPPDNEHRAWEPERIQLCVQALLLREHGYRCERGALWFAGSRERVTVDFDNELVERTNALLADLRAAAAASDAPPPLVDSPKCPRCSLVGICLPDEVNTLAVRSSRPPRRLIPADGEARPLYVTEQGAWVGKDKGRVTVTRKDAQLLSVRLIDVSQVCIYGNVQVSTQLLRELFAHDIPTCWFSYGGWFSGMATGLPAKNVELRRRQVIAAAQNGADIARSIVAGKIRNQRTLLRRNTRDRDDHVLDSLASLADRAALVTTSSSLLGVEGTAARLYFEQFPTMIRPDKRIPGAAFSFEGRKRRPPPDAINCLLSFVYGLVVKDLTVTCWAVGLDPYIGFYHRPRFGRPSLALDIAEEFRPLVGDSVVLQVVNNGEVKGSDFVIRAGGVALTAEGRKAVLMAYERRLAMSVRHPIFGYDLSYRRLMEVQVRMLGALLLGEIPQYVAFTTR